LNVVDVLVSANPGWSGSQVRKVVGVDDEVFVFGSHCIEVLGWLSGWNSVMSCFVEVIVDNLSEVDNTPFLNLNFRSFVEFNSGSVNKSKISDVVLTSEGDDHELGLPKFLIVWNLIMIGLTFSNLENSSITLENDFNVF
jgi:hypothetical protein